MCLREARKTVGIFAAFPLVLQLLSLGMYILLT